MTIFKGTQLRAEALEQAYQAVVDKRNWWYGTTDEEGEHIPMDNEESKHQWEVMNEVLKAIEKML